MDLRSTNGVLKLDFFYRSELDSHGRTRYCYIDKAGVESPTLRLHPGDLLILTLQNELQEHGVTASLTIHQDSAADKTGSSDPCLRPVMSPVATNLHFHGLAVPPVCHQDDVLKTSILPGSTPFEYRFYIPKDQPPGLYWYHPHLHGFTRAQVLGEPPVL